MNEHECELFLKIKFPFTDVKPFTFKNVWSAWCGINKDTPKGDYYMESEAAITRERISHADSEYWWVIHPFSYIRLIWDIFMTAIFMIAFFTIPFMVCFIIMDYQKIRLDNVNIPIYAICWVDILFNCITGCYNKKTMSVELKPSKILMSYLKGFLMLDVISSFPYDYITLQWRRLPGNNPYYTVTLINILPFFKLTRYYTFNSNIYYFFTYSEVNHLHLKFCTTLLLGLYIIFWFSCVCYFIPILVIYLSNTPPEECKKCWMTRLEEGGFELKFKNAMFIVLENIFASGYGLFMPETDASIVFNSIFMIIGRLLVCYLLITFLHIKAERKISESKFQELIDQVKAYTRQKQLLPHMKKRLLAYYHYRFKNSYFRSRRILVNLTESLREEIAFQSCQRLIQNVTIFKNLPKNILQSIVKNLRFELYLPNDVIIKAGTQGDCMFFLSSGTVTILTPTGKEMCHLSDGAHFGEVALLVADQRRVASVIAIEVCELYRLDRKNFRQCIDMNSELFAEIERIAAERVEKTVRAEEQHKRFLMRPNRVHHLNK